MADDPVITALPDALATASEPENVETEQPVDLEELADAQANGDEEPTEATPTVEEIELEHEGQKYRLPKALEGYLLRQQDYTQKTQELSAGRKELEQVREQLTQQAQLDEREMGARVAIKALDAELANYQNVDWTQEYQKDFQNAAAHKARYDQLKEQRGQAVAFLTQRGQERTVETQRADAKRITETRDWATKNIPSWNETLDKQITDFAVAQGMTPQFIQQNVNPLLYKLLHQAYVGHQALTRSAAKPAPKTIEAKPLTVVSSRGNAPTVPSLNALAEGKDMEAFAAAFNKKMAARGRR